MKTIVKPSEIVKALGGRGIADEQVASGDIAAVEHVYIEKKYGGEFYQACVDKPDFWKTPGGVELIAYAWYYQAFERIMFEVSSRGVFQLTGRDAQPMPASERLAMKQSIADTLEELADIVDKEIKSRKGASEYPYTLATTDEEVLTDNVIAVNNKRRVTSI